VKTLTGKPPELSIVVPTYMEAENIPELIERVENALKGIPFELIIVDDNSPDGTADIAEGLNRKYGNIKVLRRPGKLGLVSAVKDGFNKAEVDVVAVMDADLQHPPELLPIMYKKLREGFDLVIASRYVERGVEGWSLWRRLLSRGATVLAHLILPKTRKVKDPLSGYFMIKKEIVDAIRLNTAGFKILLEILVKGRYHKVAEVPYFFNVRRRGVSKLDLKEILNYAVSLARLTMRR
jgi:dolichol-phosphate mannosyltransferase